MRSPQWKREPGYYLVECLPGIEPLLTREIRTRFRKEAKMIRGRDGEVAITFSGSPKELFQLSIARNVYFLDIFKIPRPRSLLSPEHFSTLVSRLDVIKKISSTVNSFRVGAAGSSSPTMIRLVEKISESTHLSYDQEQGEFLIRVRPSQFAQEGHWEVLSRLTPRPLSFRSWRVVNYPGAIDATLAAAIVQLLEPSPSDLFVNLMCGSGTLLIERCGAGPARKVIGVEINRNVLNGAEENIQAAKLKKKIELIHGDASATSFESGSVNKLCVDLPWGERVGKSSEIRGIYVNIFKEIHRISSKQGLIAVLTQREKPLENILHDLKQNWSLKRKIKVSQGGFHPTLFVFSKGQ